MGPAEDLGVVRGAVGGAAGADADRGLGSDAAHPPSVGATETGHALLSRSDLRLCGYARSASGASSVEVTHREVTRSDADRIVPAPKGFVHIGQRRTVVCIPAPSLATTATTSSGMAGGMSRRAATVIVFKAEHRVYSGVLIAYVSVLFRNLHSPPSRLCHNRLGRLCT